MFRYMEDVLAMGGYCSPAIVLKASGGATKTIGPSVFWSFLCHLSEFPHFLALLSLSVSGSPPLLSVRCKTILVARSSIYQFLRKTNSFSLLSKIWYIHIHTSAYRSTDGAAHRRRDLQPVVYCGGERRNRLRPQVCAELSHRYLK